MLTTIWKHVIDKVQPGFPVSVPLLTPLPILESDATQSSIYHIGVLGYADDTYTTTAMQAPALKVSLEATELILIKQ